jgi:hypothetical protein
VKRKASAIEDIRKIVEDKLAKMLANNPQRMDYYKKYSEIIADYNREKDRVTIEETFAKLIELAQSLDAEQRRATEEGLSEEELALFDLITGRIIPIASGTPGCWPPRPAPRRCGPELECRGCGRLLRGALSPADRPRSGSDRQRGGCAPR